MIFVAIDPLTPEQKADAARYYYATVAAACWAAVEIGLYEFEQEDTTDELLRAQIDRSYAQAGETRRAETSLDGSVHEHATAKADAP